ncbi:MAG: hypothetical protein H0V83_11280 [Rubrobacter sp.]|nr:hypothetical protein [Rubrobacter sp.]
MKHALMLATVALTMATMLVVMAIPAFAGTFARGGTNFGQCAADEARGFPPGPEHGKDLSLARQFNPSGDNLQCDKTGL